RLPTATRFGNRLNLALQDPDDDLANVVVRWLWREHAERRVSGSAVVVAVQVVETLACLELPRFEGNAVGHLVRTERQAEVLRLLRLFENHEHVAQRALALELEVLE